MRNSRSTPELRSSRFPEANLPAFLPEKGRHAEEPAAEGLIDQILRRQAEAARLLAELELHAGHAMPTPVDKVRARQPIRLPEIEELPHMAHCPPPLSRLRLGHRLFLRPLRQKQFPSVA